MSTKTILYVITKSEPMGGAQKYVYDLARATSENDWNVVVALGGNGELKERLTSAGVEVRTIHAFQRNINVFKELQAFFELRKLLKEVSPDIMHVNSSKAGGIGAFAARILNLGSSHYIHTIFTSHGWAFTEERPMWQQVLIYLLHVCTVFLANTTIAVSNHTRDEMEEHLPSFLHDRIMDKLVVIPNGIDDFEILPQREARKKLLEHTRLGGSVNLWSTQTLWLGSIAELHTNKGIDIAIEAIARLAPAFREHNVSLVYFVIGGGEEHEHLEKLIKRRRLESVVFLLGYIPNARQYLSAFDIYLLPSRKEGLPWTILEAGHASLPVIATRVGGTQEVLSDGENGLLTKPDPAELSEAILDLAQDTKKRVYLGKDHQKYVHEHFDAGMMIKRTLRLYWMLAE